MGQHHVLLIGIDAYDGGGSLSGCVNDVDEVFRVLTTRVGIGADRITRLTSPSRLPGDRVPTLDTIRTELARLSSAEVGPGDRVLVYYSGHGTQCIVAGNDGKRFSREALLPKDKVRGPERRFLFDWELNRLIGRIAARTARVTVVLDCCSSAGVTRDLSSTSAKTAARFFPSHDVYQLRNEDAWPGLDREQAGARVRGITSDLGIVPGIQLIAACRDDERAREATPDNAPAYGLLTRALVGALDEIPVDQLARLRWGRIWRAIERGVRAANPRQNPYISGGYGRHVFGFGADEDADCGYAVREVSGGYELDVGRLHGVTPGAEIAVYGERPPVFPPLGSADDLAVRCGRLRVTAADASAATAAATATFALPHAARGRLVKAGPDARLRVRLVPPNPELAARLAGSELLEIIAGDGDADVELVQRPDQAWAITDDIHGRGDDAIEPELVALTPDRMPLARAALEHYHGYSAPLRLARACRDLPDLLHISVLDATNPPGDEQEAQDPRLPLVEGGLRASYEVSSGAHVCFVVDNASDVALQVTLICCAMSGRVQILGEQVIRAHSRYAFWANDRLGAPFAMSLPDKRPSGIDRIVAIGTTNRAVSLQYLRRSMSFEEVLNPRRTVRATPDPERPLPVEQWTAAMTTVRITAQSGRPQSDLWIWLTGKPDDFTSSVVPLAGSPITSRHRLAISQAELDAATTWASGGQRWLKLAAQADDLPRTVGTQLFKALFDGSVGDVLNQHRASAQCVRLRLHLDSPELNALPWEFLYDDARHDYLGLSPDFAIVRSFEPESSPWLPYARFELPIGVLVADLTGTARTPKSSEYQTTVYRPQSRAELETVLAGSTADVIQLDAYGGRDERGLRLAICGEDHLVRDADLTTLLASAKRRPRVVLLLACHSDAVARALGRSGVAEAVIGVRGDVSDAAAGLFTEKFYAALATGAPVIRAVDDARRALDLEMPGQREWGLFTLHHRAGDLAVEPRRAVAVPKPVTAGPAPDELAMLRRTLQEIDERLHNNDPRRQLLLKQRADVLAQLAALEGQAP